MRILLALLLLVTPALAADWERYDNARFGYSIEVPPGFAWGPEPDNGDGRQFRAGATKLAVWGGNVIEPDLETSAASDIAAAESDGWSITYRATTPSWASISGTQGQRILYERMITLCDPGQYAGFLIEYSVADRASVDPMVDRLVATLRPVGC